MNHLYDFYANFQIDTEDSSNAKSDIDDLTKKRNKYKKIEDTLSRIKLLSTAFGVKSKLPDKNMIPNRINSDVYAKVGEGENDSGLKTLIHVSKDYNKDIKKYLDDGLQLIYNSNSNKSVNINILNLPKGSWIIKFKMTLLKSFISNDDTSFYIIDNPVKKDKVFGIPYTSAMSWKGNLRWTMMKIHLEPLINSPEEFADMRFLHTLLFGSEKGMEEESAGWANYLDNLCQSAKKNYQNKLKEEFKQEKIPNIKGTLFFYPTFWNEIDMDVINPHNRKTKSGKNPIYYEIIPEGAIGSFRLLYIPIHYFACKLSDDSFFLKILQDMLNIVVALKEMMLIYGFSAKKSCGFGVIKDEFKESLFDINGIDIKEEDKQFKNFSELEEKVKSVKQKTFKRRG
jgi:CRISPR-associated protein Cmr2